MRTILNLSAYLFADLGELPVLRQRLLDHALRLQLRGTVLLAEEGINLFIAGPEAPVREFLDLVRAQPGLDGLQAKESWSEAQPFGRMRVRIKREIIRMNHPAIRPAAGRAPSLPAATLKRWLDQGHDDDGRPVVTLDTRNAFEVDHGAFDGAIDWRIHKFTEFPDALAQHKDQLAGKTVVSYCTGGIRCEKAAILMREMGVEQVWQLEGGILKYFEEAGGAHWRGSCFVFDEREALGPDLAPAAVV